MQSGERQLLLLALLLLTLPSLLTLATLLLSSALAERNHQLSLLENELRRQIRRMHEIILWSSLV